jgi:hypothetical protein
MKRTIDQFDLEAAKEADAIDRMRHYTKDPEKASKSGKINPKRLFDSIRCHDVELLSPQKYRHFKRFGFYNQYRPVRNENKQPVETKCE